MIWQKYVLNSQQLKILVIVSILSISLPLWLVVVLFDPTR
jgi:hypothetical protein